MLGIRTRGVRLVGIDESTDLWRPLIQYCYTYRGSRFAYIQLMLLSKSVLTAYCCMKYVMLTFCLEHVPFTSMTLELKKYTLIFQRATFGGSKTMPSESWL